MKMRFADARNLRQGTYFERAMERCRTRTWVEDIVVRNGRAGRRWTAPEWRQQGNKGESERAWCR